MKLLPVLCLCGFLFCIPLQSFGQKSALSNAFLVKKYTVYKNPDTSLSHLNYFQTMAREMGLSGQSKMVLTEESTGKNGYTHYKYQQFHAGLPIFGSRYMLHEKAGKVISATGHFSPQACGTDKPGINAATAIAFAQKAMNAAAYSTNRIEPVLCFVDPSFPKVSQSLRLAYQVDLQSIEPFDKRRYFVDAVTGEIIRQFPLIFHQGVPSTAKTKYYGVQNIITDSIAPTQFILRDPSRGQGIFIYNGDNSPFTNSTSNWDLTNPQQDEVALDAQFCSQEYYDMMLADYNWNGLDGNGKALKARVHNGNYNNALWDGVYTAYGDGDCIYGPLTTLEVVGHEYTHGMIEYASMLIYAGESGAINESLADIFGKLLEHKTDPANFSWEFGRSNMLNAQGTPYRIMNNPKSKKMPAFYKGQYWLDYNDVHINSAIGNLWFTILAEGKQGINEEGVAFDAPGIGFEKAGQIVFDVNRHFFTENSDYNEFYQYSIIVAEFIYGAGSIELQTVLEAWKAVGVNSVPSTFFDLSVLGDTSLNNNFCGLGQHLPVRFKILNSSNVSYDPSSMASVTLSALSVPDFIVQLTNPIGPGEIIEIQANDWLKANTPGNVTVHAALNFTDGAVENNMNAIHFKVSPFASNDVSISGTFVPANCFDTLQYIGIDFKNNSCETLSPDSLAQIIVTDDLGNLLLQSSLFNVGALPGGSSTKSYFGIPYTSSNLIFTLLYPSDPNPINNQFNASIKSYLPITDNYLNTFELNFGHDDYLDLRTNSNEPTLFYQNSHFFASTGQAPHPDDFQQCSNGASVFNFESPNGINAVLHTCIDFSFAANPVLEFDLAQFRNEIAPTDLYSSMLQAKWTGSESGDQVILDQPEGLVKHYHIALPPYFKGALELKLYTEIGQGTLDSGLLTEDDFVLLDNLQLSAPTSGTEEIASTSPIFISPNPARETVMIQAGGGIKTILLQNVNGQILQTVQVNATRYDLDLKGLHNGFYLLNVQLENGQWAVKKLVKMD